MTSHRARDEAETEPIRAQSAGDPTDAAPRDWQLPPQSRVMYQSMATSRPYWSNCGEPYTDPNMFDWAYDNPPTAPHLLANQPGYVPPPPHVCYVPFYQRWWFWVIVAMLIMSLLGSVGL